MIAGALSLKYGKYMAIASATLLTIKNVEVPIKPPMVNVEKLESNSEESENVFTQELTQELIYKNLSRTYTRTYQELT